MATLAGLPSHSKRGWQWGEGGGKCQQYGWPCQYCQGLEVINRQLEMSFQLPRETGVRHSSYLFILGGNALCETIHGALLYLASCEDWYVHLAFWCVWALSAPQKCFASLCTVRCAFVIYNVNRKCSQGSYAVLAENGLGNLKRFLTCSAFLWMPGDYLHVHVLAKGAGPLHALQECIVPSARGCGSRSMMQTHSYGITTVYYRCVHGGIAGVKMCYWISMVGICCHYLLLVKVRYMFQKWECMLDMPKSVLVDAWVIGGNLCVKFAYLHYVLCVLVYSCFSNIWILWIYWRNYAYTGVFLL